MKKFSSGVRSVTMLRRMRAYLTMERPIRTDASRLIRKTNTNCFSFQFQKKKKTD